MNKREVSAEARHNYAERSTKASAKLEQRVVPDGYVSSDKVEAFIASLRAKA